MIHQVGGDARARVPAQNVRGSFNDLNYVRELDNVKDDGPDA